MLLSNKALAAQFFKLHNLTMKYRETEQDKFRAASYARVGKLILEEKDPVWENLGQFSLMPGVGKSSIEKIKSYISSPGNIIPQLKELEDRELSKEHLVPIFAVIELNDGKILKRSSINGIPCIEVEVAKEKEQRLQNMLRGVAYPQKEKNLYYIGIKVKVVLKRKGNKK